MPDKQFNKSFDIGGDLVRLGCYFFLYGTKRAYPRLDIRGYRDGRVRLSCSYEKYMKEPVWSIECNNDVELEAALPSLEAMLSPKRAIELYHDACGFFRERVGASAAAEQRPYPGKGRVPVPIPASQINGDASGSVDMCAMARFEMAMLDPAQLVESGAADSPTAHFVWVSTDQCKTPVPGQATLGIKSMPSSQKIVFWCLRPSAGAPAPFNFGDKAEVAYIEDFMEGLIRDSKPQLSCIVEEAYKRIQGWLKPGHTIAHLVSVKELFGLVLLYFKGGVTLDTNVVASVEGQVIKLPVCESFCMPYFEHSSKAGVKRFDVWLLSAPKGSLRVLLSLQLFLEGLAHIEKHFTCEQDQPPAQYRAVCASSYMQSIVLFKNNGQSKGDSPNYNGCLGIDVKRMVQGCGSQVDALGLVKYYFNTHRGLQRRKDQILDVTVHDRVMAHMIDCMNDVNQPVQGWSLLTLALFHGSLRIADVLLAKGATMKLEQLEQNLNGVIGLFGNDAEPLVASVLRLCDVKCISFLEKTLYRMERRRCYPRMVFKVDFYPRVRKCIEDKLSELKALASGDLSQSLCA